jgi:hypothetical protein
VNVGLFVNLYVKEILRKGINFSRLCGFKILTLLNYSPEKLHPYLVLLYKGTPFPVPLSHSSSHNTRLSSFLSSFSGEKDLRNERYNLT